MAGQGRQHDDRHDVQRAEHQVERAAEARAAELGVEFINLTTEVQDAEAQKNAVDDLT